MRTDVSCFLGHWPFRKLYKSSLRDLKGIHQQHGITSGYVSSMNSIFYNDPFEGEEELHEWIKQEPAYHHVLTVNPMLPGFVDDIKQGVDEFEIKGVRIYPSYHQYGLEHESMQLLCETLSTFGLPLFLTLRMEDERLNYLMKPQSLDVSEIERFMNQYRDQRIVLSHVRYAELMALKDIILALPGVYFDTVGLKDQMFVIEKMLQVFPADKLLYGSLYPLHCLTSTKLLIDCADILEDEKDQIWCDSINAERGV